MRPPPPAASALTGTSIYETWVKTVRAWATDPTTPLTHLPPLADDTFTPETYQRLIAHLTSALDTVSTRWAQALSTSVATVTDEHDLARELIALRSLLARRAQLSLHPSLPPGARKPFEENLRDSIRRYQSDLEKAFAPDRTSARLDDAHRARMLAVVRQHPLNGVLDYAITQDGHRITTPAVNPTPQPDGPTRAPRRRWRQIQPPTSDSTASAP